MITTAQDRQLDSSGVLTGLSSFGSHIGVGSSYAAFVAALGHVPARLHGIGNQSKQSLNPGEPYKPFFLVCAHAGLKTGEDGPTHALNITHNFS